MIDIMDEMEVMMMMNDVYYNFEQESGNHPNTKKWDLESFHHDRLKYMQMSSGRLVFWVDCRGVTIHKFTDSYIWR